MSWEAGMTGRLIHLQKLLLVTCVSGTIFSLGKSHPCHCHPCIKRTSFFLHVAVAPCRSNPHSILLVIPLLLF